MKRKFLVGLLAIVSVFALAFGLSACGSDNGGNSTGDKWGDVYTIEAAYAEAVNLGYSGTLEEFIASISGKDGANGVDGKSAYEIWLEAGHEGTEEDFLAWLKGEDENSQGLDFYPLGDGSTYGVAVGYAKYLDAIEIPSTYRGKPVTTILDNSFTSSSIKSIVIPDSVTSIGSVAFSGCSSLTSITIPDSVTSIGEHAFSSCSSLTSVTIPDSVTSIGGSAFYNTAYYNDSNNWENDILYIGKHLITAKTSISGEYIIKDGTLIIADKAFYECNGLTSVTIPDSVKSIGDRAFSGCSSLTSVTIGNSVTSIGYAAFAGCNGLTSVTFENTSGWWYSSDSTATSGTSISSTDLSNTSTAATYLRLGYCSYYWKRS